MELDKSLVLLHFHAQKCFNNAAFCDTKVCSILLYELFTDPVTTRYVHHVLYEQAMENEVRSFVFHGNRFLAIYSCVSAAFHPCLDVHMPSTSCLLSSVDILQEYIRQPASGNGSGHQSRGYMYTTSSPMSQYRNDC